ncbi:Alb1 domain-containing protein [Trichoderma barbatum]
MAQTQKRAPSKRSRAARRATSPSINTDKSLKDVSLPSASSSSARPSVLAARHSAGVTKKSKRGRQLSARGRRRQEKGLEMAEAFIERTSMKLEKSIGKSKVVQARSKKWDDINKSAQESKANAFEVLKQGGDGDDDGKGAEWETDDDMDGDDAAKADTAAAASTATPVLDDDNDEIM